jgi:NAD(P)-dependent dehydrogenase (short-subunit alcohol dehydrogenase family)
MDVAGRTMVVTGGGDGIGRQVVLELLRRGASVAAVDLRQEALDETERLAAAGGRLATFRVDVTDADAVAALPAQVVSALGQVDGVVNVAGIIQPFVRVEDLDDATIRRVIDVNLYGTLHVVRAFLPHLRQRPAAHIANVSSMGGYLPVPGQTVYGASKAAVRLLTEGLYAELLDSNVHVSVIFPGAVRTDITAHSGVDTPAGASEQESRFPTTEPDAAARTIVDGIEKGRLYVYVGRDALVTGWMQRLAPKLSTRLIQRQMRSLLPSR